MLKTCSSKIVSLKSMVSKSMNFVIFSSFSILMVLVSVLPLLILREFARFSRFEVMFDYLPRCLVILCIGCEIAC